MSIPVCRVNAGLAGSRLALYKSIALTTENNH
jgi:hypothetical protein